MSLTLPFSSCTLLLKDACLHPDIMFSSGDRHTSLLSVPCLVPPQEVPEAAALLVTDGNAARNVPQLSALAYWAPSRLLQATALLTGAAGRHKAVRAYALRSLTTTATPEEVCLRPDPDLTVSELNLPSQQSL